MEAGNRNYKRPVHPVLFFSKKEKEHIKNSIEAAEKYTSGEIRVHIAGSVKNDVIIEAKDTFEKIGMTNTIHRNGVLIFFAIRNRSFAIIGDSGIHQKIGDDQWKEIAMEMQSYFRKDDFAGGLEYGIKRIGQVLSIHFPHNKDDLNELPDDISFGE